MSADAGPSDTQAQAASDAGDKPAVQGDTQAASAIAQDLGDAAGAVGKSLPTPSAALPFSNDPFGPSSFLAESPAVHTRHVDAGAPTPSSLSMSVPSSHSRSSATGSGMLDDQTHRGMSTTHVGAFSPPGGLAAPNNPLLLSTGSNSQFAGGTPSSLGFGSPHYSPGMFMNTNIGGGGGGGGGDIKSISRYRVLAGSPHGNGNGNGNGGVSSSGPVGLPSDPSQSNLDGLGPMQTPLMPTHSLYSSAASPGNQGYMSTAGYNGLLSSPPLGQRYLGMDPHSPQMQLPGRMGMHAASPGNMLAPMGMSSNMHGTMMQRSSGGHHLQLPSHMGVPQMSHWASSGPAGMSPGAMGPISTSGQSGVQTDTSPSMLGSTMNPTGGAVGPTPASSPAPTSSPLPTSAPALPPMSSSSPTSQLNASVHQRKMLEAALTNVQQQSVQQQALQSQQQVTHLQQQLQVQMQLSQQLQAQLQMQQQQLQSESSQLQANTGAYAPQAYPYHTSSLQPGRPYPVLPSSDPSYDSMLRNQQQMAQLQQQQQMLHQQQLAHAALMPPSSSASSSHSRPSSTKPPSIKRDKSPKPKTEKGTSNTPARMSSSATSTTSGTPRKREREESVRESGASGSESEGEGGSDDGSDREDGGSSKAGGGGSAAGDESEYLPQEYDADGQPLPRAKKIIGSSCHQCKTRREGDELIKCGMSHAKKGRAKKRKAERKCRKKYCSRCLLKFYGEPAPPKPEPGQPNTWACPGCRGLCTCAACKRTQIRREAKRKKLALQQQQQQAQAQAHAHALQPMAQHLYGGAPLLSAGGLMHGMPYDTHLLSNQTYNPQMVQQNAQLMELLAANQQLASQQQQQQQVAGGAMSMVSQGMGALQNNGMSPPQSMSTLHMQSGMAPQQQQQQPLQPQQQGSYGGGANYMSMPYATSSSGGNMSGMYANTYGMQQPQQQQQQQQQPQQQLPSHPQSQLQPPSLHPQQSGGYYPTNPTPPPSGGPLAPSGASSHPMPYAPTQVSYGGKPPMPHSFVRQMPETQGGMHASAPMEGGSQQQPQQPSPTQLQQPPAPVGVRMSSGGMTSGEGMHGQLMSQQQQQQQQAQLSPHAPQVASSPSRADLL